MDHSCSRGPVSTMPGSQHTLPEGAQCDLHDAPAVVRVQGETDSFGCEYVCMCQPCFDAYKLEKETLKGGAFFGTCDSCKTTGVPQYPYRDHDEGQSGPVYYQCADCRTKRFEREAREADDAYPYDQYEFD